LIVLKEGVGVGVARVCVCVCVCFGPVCLSPSESLVSRSLPSWLAGWLARNGAGRRLTDGNNVQ
jgi:hypothetical protein